MVDLLDKVMHEYHTDCWQPEKPATNYHPAPSRDPPPWKHHNEPVPAEDCQPPPRASSMPYPPYPGTQIQQPKPHWALPHSATYAERGSPASGEQSTHQLLDKVLPHGHPGQKINRLCDLLMTQQLDQSQHIGAEANHSQLQYSRPQSVHSAEDCSKKPASQRD
ncbi:hypothetical protein AAFF_G00066810 [Aldrovandia affinis]|uniref:Uncharacterized protein n=1 Tax=Aldrovandia affinis TaxID=143900 RepID=A0AAD7T4A7_9TELE|nr:hypothetical protein AAFF_G00066810 [Aldrovandia affinis]